MIFLHDTRSRPLAGFVTGFLRRLIDSLAARHPVGRREADCHVFR
jgi:hypothetical protein